MIEFIAAAYKVLVILLIVMIVIKFF